MVSWINMSGLMKIRDESSCIRAGLGIMYVESCFGFVEDAGRFLLILHLLC